MQGDTHADRGMAGNPLGESEAHLRPTGEQYGLLFERMPHAIMLVDPLTATVVDANPAARAFYADATDSLVGCRLWDLNGMPPERALEMLGGFLERPETVFQTRHQPPAPSRDVEIFTGPVEIDGRTLLYSISHDITERLRTEQQHERLTRLAAALSALDSTLRGAADEDTAWRMTARMLTAAGGFPAVYVGLIEPADRAMRVFVVDGDEESLQRGIKRVEGTVRNSSPGLSQALDAGKPFLHRIVNHDPITGWATGVADLGVTSAAAIPIRMGGFAVGVLGLLAREEDYFGEAELGLVEQVAAMVASRLGELERARRERELAETLEGERRRSERFAVSMAEVDRALIRLVRPEDIYREVCRLAVEVGECALAWIGILEADGPGRRLRISASAGDTSFLETSGHQSWANVKGNPPMPVSETIVSNDLLSDARFKGRSAAYEQAGFLSAAGVPLYIGARHAGSLALYSRAAGAFGPEQIAVLERLIANAGSRLAVLEAESRRRAAEKKLARIADSAASNARDGAGPKS